MPDNEMIAGGIAASTGPLLRRREVERETGLSTPTIYRLMKAGTFPRPRRIGTQAVAWTGAEIEAWKASRPVTVPAGQK